MVLQRLAFLRHHWTADAVRQAYPIYFWIQAMAFVTILSEDGLGCTADCSLRNILLLMRFTVADFDQT